LVCLCKHSVEALVCLCKHSVEALVCLCKHSVEALVCLCKHSSVIKFFAIHVETMEAHTLW